MKPIILVVLVASHALGSSVQQLIDGYDYPPPSCPLTYPSTVTSTVPLTIKESVTKTETIVTILKPRTTTSTLIVPTTTTEIRTSTCFITEKSTATRFFTTTIPVTTVLTTTLCTLDNGYLPAKNDPTCVPPPPSTYLPEDILPPFGPSILINTDCPDASTVTITKTAPPASTLTKTIRIQPTRRSNPVTTSTKLVMRDVVTVTKSLTRTKSVILYDQLVTKLVSVTPTLTSYVYLEPVTKTMPARRSPPISSTDG